MSNQPENILRSAKCRDFSLPLALTSELTSDLALTIETPVSPESKNPWMTINHWVQHVCKMCHQNRRWSDSKTPFFVQFDMEWSTYRRCCIIIGKSLSYQLKVCITVLNHSNLTAKLVRWIVITCSHFPCFTKLVTTVSWLSHADLIEWITGAPERFSSWVGGESTATRKLPTPKLKFLLGFRLFCFENSYEKHKKILPK